MSLTKFFFYFLWFTAQLGSKSGSRAIGNGTGPVRHWASSRRRRRHATGQHRASAALGVQWKTPQREARMADRNSPILIGSALTCSECIIFHWANCPVRLRTGNQKSMFLSSFFSRLLRMMRWRRCQFATILDSDDDEEEKHETIEKNKKKKTKKKKKKKMAPEEI